MRLNKTAVEKIIAEMLKLDKQTQNPAKVPFVVPILTEGPDFDVVKIIPHTNGIFTISSGACMVNFYPYSEVKGFRVTEGFDEEDDDD